MTPYVYTPVSAFCPARMRGTNQQTNTGLLYLPPSGALGALTTNLIEGLAVGYASLHNRSGSTGVVGLAARLPNRLWIAGQYTNSTTTYTDDTTDAQSTAASDFPLETAATNNNGFIIASPVKFGAVSLNVGTASSGGAPVRAVSYSNSAGTGWTTATNLLIQDGASGALSTGERLIVFEPWADWGTTASGLATNLPTGLYAMLVQATTAPAATAASASSLEVFKTALGTEAIADNGTFEYTPSQGEMRFADCDGLVAIFETANAGNRATVHVRTA